jgi:hypothetical protein
VALALCAPGYTQKKSDISLADMKAVRLETKVTIDLKVKVTSEKPIKGLVLVVDYLDADKSALASEKALVTEDTIKTGEDQPLHLDSRFPPGAVRFKIRAFDNAEKELRVANPGPFVIE